PLTERDRLISFSTALARSETSLECHCLWAAMSVTRAWQSGQAMPEGFCSFVGSTVLHLLRWVHLPHWHAPARRSTAKPHGQTWRRAAQDSTVKIAETT